MILLSRACFRSLAVLAALVVETGVSAESTRTNVVLIVADDLGYGDLACFGHPKFRTPHLDRLAAEGARLTHFYAPVPYCAPTRASLMTGRYPNRCGLTGNPVPAADPAGGNDQSDRLGLPLAEVTLADVFLRGGYRTACYGKWHLGHRPEFLPTRRGFDDYLGILYSNDMHPVELIDGETMVEYPVVQATLTTRLADRAVDFVKANHDRPFFLYLPHVAVHKPLFASEAHYQKSGSGLYGDCLGELDAAVGRIVEAIDAAGLKERTLVVFTSDNGPWYGGSTGGLRGMKGQTWEGGLRVPLIARWPGVIPPGHVSAEPAVMMDLFPTLLTAAGLTPPAGVALDGRDIRPLLISDAKTPHESIFGLKGDRVHSVRSGRWKLHVAAPGPTRDRRWRPDEPWIDPRRPDGVRLLAPYEQAHPSEFPGLLDGPVFGDGLLLFDLVADPGEQRDVAADHSDVVERLRGMISRFESEVAAGRQTP